MFPILPERGAGIDPPSIELSLSRRLGHPSNKSSLVSPSWTVFDEVLLVLEGPLKVLPGVRGLLMLSSYTACTLAQKRSVCPDLEGCPTEGGEEET